uniref:Uncharacterized protein n=1 Tax=Globisporangium ultimum (strain ATCC 200006 / CBS 805.95 / DAOM BR144) TaxID=431595 RepID=K3X4D3_GLOUD
MMMFAARRLRHFSTQASAPRPRQEYPTSFVSHLKTQKLNVFNIGMAFLTLSLSSQLVSYKQKHEKLAGEKEQLSERVHVLEQLVVSLGGEVPVDDEVAAATAAEATKAEQEKAQRDEEAQLLAAMTAPSDSSKSAPKKGMLI